MVLFSYEESLIQERNRCLGHPNIFGPWALLSTGVAIHMPAFAWMIKREFLNGHIDRSQWFEYRRILHAIASGAFFDKQFVVQDHVAPHLRYCIETWMDLHSPCSRQPGAIDVHGGWGHREWEQTLRVLEWDDEWDVDLEDFVHNRGTYVLNDWEDGLGRVFNEFRGDDWDMSPITVATDIYDEETVNSDEM